jgi:hypothetical protein
VSVDCLHVIRHHRVQPFQFFQSPTAMSQAENLYTITSPEQFQQLLSADLERISLLNFWAEWAEPCKKMNEVVSELARTNPQLLTLSVCLVVSLSRSGRQIYLIVGRSRLTINPTRISPNRSMSSPSLRSWSSRFVFSIDSESRAALKSHTPGA